MGRRKGSLNRKKGNGGRGNEVLVRRKRGRPRKVPVIVVPAAEVSNIQKSKFLGYCFRCKSIITNKDLESKKVYVCKGCGFRSRVSTLKKNSGAVKVSSKKEYLESTINAEFHDMPPLNDVDIGDIKVVD